MEMLPDENLYAGGISLMAKDNFLNPHLDNSHDIKREAYRVLATFSTMSPQGGPMRWAETWSFGKPRPERAATRDHGKLQPASHHGDS